MIKDIELVRRNNTFDWSFTPTDISTVGGVQRLRSALVHAVYLKYGELSMKPYYEHGNHMYEYIRAKNTTQNLEYTKEAVVLACKSVHGVADVKIRIRKTDEDIIIDELIVMTESGVEVNLGAI